MKRLAASTLDSLPKAVGRPDYLPEALGIGIVHVGLGAFHRAHQAVYTDDAIARGGGAWGISAVSLLSPKSRSQLAPQNGFYVVEERTPTTAHRRLIGCIREALFAPEERDRVRERLAARSTRIISLTITEKGYDSPQTLGLLLDGLASRMQKGTGPVTMLSCDNLPANGRVLKAALLGQTGANSPLTDWISRHVTFPSTMVDRIVPAVTDADLNAAEDALGLRDEGFVACETFKQWVIEDSFAAGRPAWELAGAELVADVEPFERMKLRLLNASHSAMAYLGQCVGSTYLHEVVAVPEYRRFVERLMETAAQTLAPGIDLVAYRRQLLDRFANTAVRHRTAQIAQDGSLKVPVRLLSTARDCLERGIDFAPVAEAVALWLVFLRRGAEGTLEVVDPRRDELLALAREHRDGRKFADKVLKNETPDIVSGVAVALARLESDRIGLRS